MAIYEFPNNEPVEGIDASVSRDFHISSEVVVEQVEDPNEPAAGRVINLDEVRRRIIDTAADNFTDQRTLLDSPVCSEVAGDYRQETLKTSKTDLYRPRAATKDDIPKLVEIDLASFRSVYEENGKTKEQLTAEYLDLYYKRLEMVGGDWIQVAEGDSGIVGFTVCCPTSKPPEDFESWEDTTDNGTLESTYDPNGKYIYVVSLCMTPEGGKNNAQEIIFMNQIGKMLEEGYEQAYFESRIPGLRSWVKKQCRENKLDPLDLTDQQKYNYAKQYVSLRTEVKGKSVAKDRLIRIFDEVGANLLKVVPDAYKDKPSMNFGALFTLDSPLPGFLKKSPTANKLAGKAMRFMSRQTAVTSRILK